MLTCWSGTLWGEEPRFKIYDPGTEEIVDYEKYGEFRNVGTAQFSYMIFDAQGLALASGEGIDPCTSVTNNPDYKKASEAGLLKGDWWRRVNTGNPQLDYFIWTGAGDDPGVRLLFVGKALEKGGHYIHALKAYRAAMILYPDSACWSAGGEFQWGVAEAAWNNIANLLRKHPELNIRLMGADVISKGEESGLQSKVNPGRLVRIQTTATIAETNVVIINTADAGATNEADAVGTGEAEIGHVNETNVVAINEEDAGAPPEADAAETNDANAALASEADVVVTNTPTPAVQMKQDTNYVERVFTGSLDEILQQRGTGTVQLVQYGNGEWRMVVEGKPYFIRGMNYSPTKVGTVPWEWSWLWGDENVNGEADCFEVWLDVNRNNRQDEDEPTVSDFKLLKDMGCNTIKLYITDAELPSFNYLVLRKMFKETGIRVIVGNFVGAYCHGSGATWDAGTDYTIRRQRESMKASVSNMVMKLKGEPWVLAWVLGNENNMELSGDVNATRTNGSKYPETYARFLNEVSKMIHAIDPDHPVGTGNLLTGLVEYYGRFAPELDYLGVNSYIGEDGFGATWEKVKQHMNRPVVIAEFGCDSYWTKKGPDEEAQSSYVLKNWEDIYYNGAGQPGAGNSIGGFVFEWVDEWWKDSLNYFEDPVSKQTSRAVFPMPFPDGFAQEEWFGIMGQGTGNASPYQRVTKKAYYDLMKVWLGELGQGKEEPGAAVME